MRTMRPGQFHGRVRGTMVVDGLTLEESEYAPGHRLPMHAHEQPFFSLLLCGTFDEKLDRRSRTCIPTSLVFYPAHEPHAEEFGESGGRSFNIELGGAWLERMRAFGIDEPSGSPEIRRSRTNWLATRLYAWFLQGAPDVGAEELVIEMIDELGAERECEESMAPVWLDRVVEQLHEGYTQVLRVTDLATEAGVHPAHLTRVFKRHMGCTIGEYVARLRIERACAALPDPGASLSKIAFDTGFADQAHFTRRFKEMTGLPPGVYRRLVTR